MYDYAGQPAKTQEKVREALSRLYVGSELGQGYPGDEDNGETSAWYLFGSLGFYPLQVGSADYAIGSPLFTKATVKLENGKKLTINAPKNSAKNIYVQGLKVNGKKYTKTSCRTTCWPTAPRSTSTWARTRRSGAPARTTHRRRSPRATRWPRPLQDVTGAGKGTATASPGTDPTALFDDTSGTRVALAGDVAVGAVPAHRRQAEGQLLHAHLPARPPATRRAGC